MRIRNIFHLSLITILLLTFPGCSEAPKPSDKHLLNASSFMALGKHKLAREEIEKAIKKDPKNAEVYYTAIALYESERMYKDAAEIGVMLIKLDQHSRLDKKLSKEDRCRIYLITGNNYIEAGDYQNAKRMYDNAIRESPDSAIILNNVGYMYADKGIFLDEALRLTKRAVELDPNEPMFIDSLGWAQYKLGKYEEAVKNLKKAVSLSPDDPELRYHLGAAYLKLGDKIAAWIELGKALKLNPSHQPARKLKESIQK